MYGESGRLEVTTAEGTSEDDPERDAYIFFIPAYIHTYVLHWLCETAWIEALEVNLGLTSGLENPFMWSWSRSGLDSLWSWTCIDFGRSSLEWISAGGA